MTEDGEKTVAVQGRIQMTLNHHSLLKVMENLVGCYGDIWGPRLLPTFINHSSCHMSSEKKRSHPSDPGKLYHTYFVTRERVQIIYALQIRESNAKVQSLYSCSKSLKAVA